MRKLPAVIWILALLFSKSVSYPAPLRASGWEKTVGPAKSVVSLAPSVTEIIYAIGAEDKLIGVSRQCDYPVAAKLKPKMGDFNRPDKDVIISASPDVVLFAEYVRPEDLKALHQEEIKAVVLSSADVADLFETIKLIGSITGRETEAKALASDMEKKVVEITSRLQKMPADDRPIVYLEVDGPKKLYTVGPGSFMSDVVRLAGGRNAFESGPAPYFQVSYEEVINADPEVILIDHPFQYKVGVSERPGWEKISGVTKGRVYDKTDFDIILLNRPGPRIINSLEEITGILHPEIFIEQ